MNKKSNQKAAKQEIVNGLYLYTDLDTVFNCSLQQAAQNILDLEKKVKNQEQTEKVC